MNRPLSPLEHVVWLIDQATQQNFTIAARLSHVSGIFTNFEPVLKQTLDMLQEKYPPLRCRIKDGRNPEFVTANVPQIPIRIIERKGDNHWIDVVEAEMIEPLPWTKGPLVRVVLLISKDKYDLLVTFCHVIADATSGAAFVKNLLNIADKLSREGKADPGPPLSELPSADNLLRDDLEFEPGPPGPDTGQYLHKPVELPGDRDFPPDKRITRVIQRCLSPAETKKLAARSKEEKTSMHGTLCAAFMQTVIKEIRSSRGVNKKGPLNIGCVTPINIRHLFSRSVEEHIGDFISQAIHYQLIDDHASIWDAARKVKESLQREMKSGNDIKAIRTIGGVLETFSTPFHLARELNNTSAPLGVTNLGRLDIPEKFGDLVLEELHFTVAINADVKSGLGLSVTTFRGRLTINFLYADPYISKQRANIIVESTMKRLKDALKGVAPAAPQPQKALRAISKVSLSEPFRQ